MNSQDFTFLLRYLLFWKCTPYCILTAFRCSMIFRWNSPAMIQEQLVSRPTDDFKCIPNEHTYMYRYYTDINTVYTFAFIACAVPLEANGLRLLEVKDSEKHISTFMDMQHAKLHEQGCSTHVRLRQKKTEPPFPAPRGIFSQPQHLEARNMDFEVSGSPAVPLGQAIQSTPTRLGTP